MLLFFRRVHFVIVLLLFAGRVTQMTQTNRIMKDEIKILIFQDIVSLNCVQSE